MSHVVPFMKLPTHTRCPLAVPIHPRLESHPPEPPWQLAGPEQVRRHPPSLQKWQTPFRQVSFWRQALVHDPQWPSSSWRFTHWPLHSVCPSGQSLHWQVVGLRILPPVQLVTQFPLQSVVPLGHWQVPL